MLEQRIKKWEQEFLAEGREKGRQEGRLDGLRTAVSKQFRLKFGRDVDPEDAVRLRRAGSERLDPWLERILTAETPEDVFRD